MAAPDRTGAHLVHLTNSAFALAFNCGICHAVPSDTSHIGGSTARATVALAQSGQGSLPPLGGPYSPPVPGSSVGGTCVTYCHGSSPSPAWDFVGLQCGSCHATPPATSKHATVTPNDLSACFGCRPDTMNASGGTLNVAGGRHVNGLVDADSHSTGWSASTAHGYSANQQGLQACTSCHTGFGAGGNGGGSCNDCHASHGHDAWQTECTFCHGTADRAFNQTGSFPVGRLVPTLTELAASPPVGPQGQTLGTDEMVGAHQKHVNPAATGARSIPIACTDCHAGPLPTGVAHVDGLLAPLPFGGIALTGGIGNASFNPGTPLTCSNTYCHGNFTGGAGASPVWTASGRLACTACHGSPPPTSTTHHPVNTSCTSCHTGYTSSTVIASTHVDGAVQKPLNGCTACHGVLAGQAGAAVDNTNPTLAAPGYIASAVDTAGNAARTFAGVGSPPASPDADAAFERLLLH